jgi:hypothetical protein
MAQRGGKRPGAGRPKGSKDVATREQGATLAELARAHTDTALQALVKVAKSGESEAARVTAATAILDRGYGRPTQSHEHTGKDGGPIEYQNLSDEEIAARIAAHEQARGKSAETAH